jgi:hypothetical protein
MFVAVANRRGSRVAAAMERVLGLPVAGRFGGSVDAEGNESVVEVVGKSTAVQGLPLEASGQGSPAAFLAP